MLRVDQTTATIPTDYRDDYLELTSLLVEAAGLEHSLMIGYLYALFSIKDEYARVRGDLSLRAFLEHPPAGRYGSEVLMHKDTFLDVAIEEMQHLGLVNQFLCELGAAPCLMPHVFPYTCDIYPFSIELASLSRYTTATFMWIESGPCTLSLKPSCEREREPIELIRDVRRVLAEGSKKHVPIDLERIDHLGSLYNKILTFVEKVRAAPPAFLPEAFPWGAWQDRMVWIRDQGEITHYRFFRSLFTGAAFGGDANVWQRGPKYPSLELPWRTAYVGHKDSIQDEDARQLAWLADLQYWMLLGLLDLSYRTGSRKLRYEAIEQMTLALWWLGLELAQRHHVGLPFDAMSLRYSLGRSDAQTLQIIVLLVREAETHAASLQARGLLPKHFDRDLFKRTLAALAVPG